MLLKRETLPGEIKSRVMYNLGFGKYFLNPNSLKTQVEISLLWAKLADEFPNNEQAEEAIGYAVGFMQDAHTKPNHPEEIDDAYAEVGRLLQLVEVDMMNVLGITLLFNDNDGD